MNVYFQRKIAGDELHDTLFFACGYVPSKEKLPQARILRVPGFEVKIVNFRNITVNGTKCKSTEEAKSQICRSVI
jgi:hypothetical protein